MTKTWLIRRSVLSPLSLATISRISSSVCRLPFISSSARPERTSSTAFAAAAWLCGTSTSSQGATSRPAACAAASTLCAGPTRMGRMMPASAASTAPPSELASQGWATAQGIGRIARVAAISRSYFSCRRAPGVATSFIAAPRCRCGTGCPGASPGEVDADVPGHPVRIVEDLGAEPVAERLQVLLVELVALPGAALQGFRPVRAGVVDRAAVVGAPSGRKAHHHQLAHVLLGGAADGGVQQVHDVGPHVPGHEGLAQVLLLLVLLLLVGQALADLGHLLVLGDLVQILGTQVVGAHRNLRSPWLIARPGSARRPGWPVLDRPDPRARWARRHLSVGRRRGPSRLHGLGGLLEEADDLSEAGLGFGAEGA